MTDLPAVSVDNLPSDTLLTEVLGNRDMGGGIAQTVRVPVAALANLLAPFGTHVVFATKADMDASLAYPANTGAEVWADGTASNNGLYRKVGASGSGSWAKVSNLALADMETRLDGYGAALASATLNERDRPGEAIDQYSNVTVGLPEDLASLPDTNVVTVTGRGRSYRAEGTAVVAHKGMSRIEGARKYLVRAGVRRAVDGGDPAGDAVVLAIQMLAADGTASGSPVALATLEDLTVASGARVVEVVVSTVAAADVDVVIPAGIYARVYWHTYGSTCETDIEFLTRPQDITAALAEAAARAAGDADAINAAILNVGRPGERPDLFTGSLLGVPSSLTALPYSGVVTVSDGGRVYRITPTDPPAARILAPRGYWRVENGRLYRLRGVLRRVTNTLGTPSDLVSFGLQAMTASAGDISRPDLGANFSGLAVGQRVTADVVVSTVAGAGVDVVLPAGTVYIRPYWWINTTTCVNDVESIEPVLDVTDWGVLSPDVTALTSRVSGIESQQGAVLAALAENQEVAQDAVIEAQAAVDLAQDLLETAQTAIAAPSISYETLPDLQASTAPGGGAWPDGVVGIVLTGDDAGSYVKDTETSGGWKLLSRDTPQAVATRVATLEGATVINDEVTSSAPALIFRGTDGKTWLRLYQDGSVDIVPADTLGSLINDRVFPRLRLSVADDENPITPIISTLDNKRLLGVDKKGGLTFPPSDALKIELQASPLANIQVTDRLPTAADGAAAGYSVGQDWIHNQRCYVCVQNTPTAVWAAARAHYPVAGNGFRDGRLPLPGDVINGEVPLVAAGLTRMLSEYNGPAALFRRDSDSTTLTLQFVGDNADMAALYNFIRGTKGRLETLYNQGSGADLTWTGDSRPVVSPAPMVGNAFGIIFETPLIYNGTLAPNQGLAIPSSITGTTDNVAVFWAGCFSHSQRSIPIIELSGAKPMGFGHHISATAKGIAVAYDGAWRTTTYHPHIGAMVCGFSSSSSGLTIYASDRNTTTLSAVSSSSWAGGVMGLITVGFFASNGVDKYQGGTIMGGILIYGRATTSEESLLIRRSMEAHFDMRPQVRGSIIDDGDSIEDGAYGTAFESIARRTARLTRRPANFYLVARSGGTLLSQANAWEDISNITQYTDPYSILYSVPGSNDINSGASTSDMTTRLASYLSTVRSSPLTAIIMANIRPRGFDSAKETVRQAYNQILRDEWSSTYELDGFLDYATVSPIGIDGANKNTSLYVDETHQTDLSRGYEAVPRADLIDTVMLAKGLI